jgi:hypothetical protein
MSIGSERLIPPITGPGLVHNGAGGDEPRSGHALPVPFLPLASNQRVRSVTAAFVNNSAIHLCSIQSRYEYGCITVDIIILNTSTKNIQLHNLGYICGSSDPLSAASLLVLTQGPISTISP